MANIKSAIIDSGRELSPLDYEKIAVPGPGGHSSVIVRNKHEDWRYLHSMMTLEVIPEANLDDDYYFRNRTIKAQAIAGQPVNVGGWVLNQADDGTVENIDTGETVPLTGEDDPDNWNVVGIKLRANFNLAFGAVLSKIYLEASFLT